MWIGVWWLCVTLLLTGHASGLKIGAFNIQIFGQSKARNAEVMSVIAQILQRYDVVLVMEVRDVRGTAIHKLLNETNRNNKSPFSMIVSDRLGRTSSKEQYAFLYRNSSGLRVTGSYHYDDGDEHINNDTFQREPFIVRFRSDKTVVHEFVLVAVHTEPRKTVAELISLLDVHDDIVNKWTTENIIILGDLNADCSSVPKKAWPTIQIRQMDKFYWPISDDVDTTVGNTDCAYDRFIVSGRDLINSIISNQTKVFNFQQAFSLSQTEAMAISDHFPIDLELAEAAGEGTTLLSLSSLMLLTITFISIKFCMSRN